MLHKEAFPSWGLILLETSVSPITNIASGQLSQFYLSSSYV